jgi:hypothetical protein
MYVPEALVSELRRIEDRMGLTTGTIGEVRVKCI